jgi:hypothetical protein
MRVQDDQRRLGQVSIDVSLADGCCGLELVSGQMKGEAFADAVPSQVLPVDIHDHRGRCMLPSPKVDTRERQITHNSVPILSAPAIGAAIVPIVNEI